MTSSGANIFLRRSVVTLALMITSLMEVRQVQAQTCTPATSTGTPINGQAVTCTGGTITANGVNGYGTGTETGDTIHVISSLQLSDPLTIVTGTAAGIAVHDGTILNLGSGTIPTTITATGADGIAISATTDITVTNGRTSTIEASKTGGIAIQAGGAAAVTNNNVIKGDIFGILATTLDVKNSSGATISSANGVGIQGSGDVVNAGTISGAGSVSGPSVKFKGSGINTLTLKSGSKLIGDAQGSAAVGATNNLILQGNGTADNDFETFSSLRVQGIWLLNGNAIATETATIETGELDVGDGGHKNAFLAGNVTVNGGARLSGLGTIAGDVSVLSGGRLAPGFAFGALRVTGKVDFAPGSIFLITASPTEASQLKVGGNATLNGAAVQVGTGGTAFAPSTKYTILTAFGGGLGGTNTFNSKVTTNSLFLTPTLSYSAAGTDVFLTLCNTNITTCSGGTGGGGGGGSSFATFAQTRNQGAVAVALDAGVSGANPVTNPLLLALLNLSTATDPRQAFDALSGEVVSSVKNTQTGQMQFARTAMLGRMRQASYYYDAPGGLGALSFGGPELAYASGDAGANANASTLAAVPGKAPAPMRGPSRDLTFWAQGLGGWGHVDSDGNAASVKSRFGGFLSGADARFGDTLRAGLVAGYMRTDLNVADRSSSAGIDSVQFGAYAGGRLGAFNVRGGASYSYDSIDTSRAIFFPGFTDKASAHFHGNVGQVFGEVGYGMALGSVAVEPLAGLAYVHVHDGSFQETGGLAALSASSANESTGYSTLGLRTATAVPLANGTVLIPRAMLQWQHAFGDVTPVTALAFQSTGTAFTVAGVPIARNTALVEGGFDWRFSPQAKLGASYQGALAAHAQTHAFKGGLTWDF